MKKRISMLIVVCMILALTACGTKKENQSDQSPAAGKPQAEEETAGGRGGAVSRSRDPAGRRGGNGRDFRGRVCVIRRGNSRVRAAGR